MSKNVPLSRPTSGILRVGTVLCFALAVAVGATPAPTDAFAKPPSRPSDDAPANPAVVRDLEAESAILMDAVSADLEARVEAKANAIVDQAAEQQIAAFLERSWQTRAVRSPSSDRADGRTIATYVVWADLEVEAPALGDASVDELDADPVAYTRKGLQAPPASVP